MDELKEMNMDSTEANEEVLETVEHDYGALAMHSTVSVNNLTVQRVKTNTNDTDSQGALTLTCTDSSGRTITVHTGSKLIREDQSIVVESDFPIGTVISVKGIIDYHYGYQIRVFNINDITIAD